MDGNVGKDHPLPTKCFASPHHKGWIEKKDSEAHRAADGRNRKSGV